MVEHESTIYCKILNKHGIHHDYKYVMGLNKLKEQFNDNSNVYYGKGRLYFTTIEHIHKYYKRGIYLVIIKLPIDNPEFKMISDPTGSILGANMLIIEQKYSLFDIKTYKKFGLDITKNKTLVAMASKYGNIKFLDSYLKYKRSNNKIYIDDNDRLDLDYTWETMNGASSAGKIEVLDWWINSGLRIKYTSLAMDSASEKGHIDVLNWWLRQKNRLKLKYTENAMDYASCVGDIKILEWWKESGLKPKYTDSSMDSASEKGQIDVLNWWVRSGLKLKYSSSSIDIAFEDGNIDVLNWWIKSDLKLKCTISTINSTLKINTFDDFNTSTIKNRVIDWWIRSGKKVFNSQLISSPIRENKSFDKEIPLIKKISKSSESTINNEHLIRDVSFTDSNIEMSYLSSDNKSPLVEKDIFISDVESVNSKKKGVFSTLKNWYKRHFKKS
jgi:hypothetical protein